MKEYKVYILLQEYKGFFGYLCKWIKGGRYNHASVGLSASMDEFYSFRSKWGLCIEHPFNFSKSYKRDVQCVIYELRVSELGYSRIHQEINSFIDNREDYYYSYLSVVLGFLGIKHSFCNGYYCSRFVAEILHNSGVKDLQKHTSLYMPSDFSQEISDVHFEGVAKEYRTGSAGC